MSIWDEIDAEREAEVMAFRAAEAAKTPEQKEAEKAAIEKRSEERHQEGVRMGWWDAEGKSISPDSSEDADEERETQ